MQYYEEALAATPQTDPNYLHLMSNLAGTLCDRSRRIDSLADLKRAVLYDEEVLATPSAHSISATQPIISAHDTSVSAT